MTERTHRQGLFVTFEGGEGAGKTTQARLLADRMEAAGLSVVQVREPGGTAVGEKIRDLILQPWQEPDPSGGGTPGSPPESSHSVSPETELLLFLAARSQLVAEVIRPALERGESVVCDRYSDSTYAYQCYGRGIDLQRVTVADELATGGLHPDLSVLLDLPIETGLARKRHEVERDSIGGENAAFHQRVYGGFKALVARDPDRWLVVDANRRLQEIAELVWQRVQRLLKQ